MKAHYKHYKPGIAHGNLIWKGKRFPMQHGRFPKDYPVTDDKIIILEQRGYFVSPFPEGDGIVIDPAKNQNPEAVKRDIEEILGFTVEKL